MVDETLIDDLIQVLKINIPMDDIAKQHLKKELSNSLKSGIARLEKIAGVTLDFITPGQARTLLFAYCRYDRSQALEVFEVNFQGALLSLLYD